MFDLIIQQGDVYDPKSNTHAIMDIGILAGKIAALSHQLDPSLARQVFDAQGLIVTPGLIDIHTHVYEHATPLGINPDVYCLGRGVTTVVDAGSAGATTFPGLRHFIIEKCATRVLAFLNISLHGLASAGCSGYGAGGELDSLNQVNELKTREAIEQNRDVIVGVKVRLSSDCANEGKNELEAYNRARTAAGDLPLMVHHTFSSIGLEGKDGCPEGLKKGDIYTHMFHGFPSTIAKVPQSRDNHGLLGGVISARERGVLFDVGHGAGSFSWTVAELCAKDRFWPDCISTDLHKDSCDAPCYDLTTTMSKLLHLGMPLMDVIKAVTFNPAQAIGWQEKIGCLRVGGVADITVLRWDTTPVWLEDSQGQLRLVNKVIKPIAVWKDGKYFPVTAPNVFPDASYQSRVPLARWLQLLVRDSERTSPGPLPFVPLAEPFSVASRFSPLTPPSSSITPSAPTPSQSNYGIGNRDTHEARFAAQGLTLPPPPKPFGVYRPTLVQKSSHDGVEVLYVSGHGPLLNDGTFMKGKVTQATKQYAKDASKQTCLAVLSTLRHTLGSLNRVKRIVKVLAMVNAVPDFEDHIEVANGFSDLLRAVFGEDGVGVRSAIGVGSLPMNIPVEMELMLEIYPQESNWISEEPSLRPVVNACGHFTSLGGSRLHPAALTAMSGISQSFVDLNSLLLHAGKRIAMLCGVPSGYSAHVTCGAAAGLALAIAACLCKVNPEGVNLPDTRKLIRRQVVVDGASDLRWNQSLQLAGAEVVVVGDRKHPMNSGGLRGALGTQVAAVIYFLGGGSEMSLATAIQVAHEKQVPIIVDAAAQLPPISNLSHFVNLGADCVIFSGGKAIAGPQDSGFMLGREWLIDTARGLACPNEASFARPMKTSKEAIAGLVAALEAFVALPSPTTYPGEVNKIARVLAARLQTLSISMDVSSLMDVSVLTGVEAGVTDVQPSAHLLVFVNIKNLDYHATTTQENLTYGAGVNHGSPLVIVPTNAPTWMAHHLASSPEFQRIAVNTTKSGLMLNPILLTEAEAVYVATRVVSGLVKLKQLQQPLARL